MSGISERLRDPRYPGQEALRLEAADEIERLLSSLDKEEQLTERLDAKVLAQVLKINEAAAFLERMAGRLEHWHDAQRAAADCRAMAAKLREGK